MVSLSNMFAIVIPQVLRKRRLLSGDAFSVNHQLYLKITSVLMVEQQYVFQKLFSDYFFNTNFHE